MSLNARDHRKSNKHRCPCGRPALYYSIARRSWRWRADHPLCTACTRSAKDSMHAARKGGFHRATAPQTMPEAA